MKKAYVNICKHLDKLLEGFSKNFWQITIYVLIVSTIFTLIVNLYNKNEITTKEGTASC